MSDLEAGKNEVCLLRCASGEEKGLEEPGARNMASYHLQVYQWTLIVDTRGSRKSDVPAKSRLRGNSVFRLGVWVGKGPRKTSDVRPRGTRGASQVDATDSQNHTDDCAIPSLTPDTSLFCFGPGKSLYISEGRLEIPFGSGRTRSQQFLNSAHLARSMAPAHVCDSLK